MFQDTSMKDLLSILIFYTFLTLIQCETDQYLVDLTYTYHEGYNPGHPKESNFDLRLVQKGKLREGVW